MAQTFSIKRLDRSGTWYLTPGTKSIYDLQISNDSKSASDCSVVLEQPASGVSVEPRVLSLRSHEVRTITVIFSADALPGTGRRVLMTVRDGSDAVQATFEQPVALTGEAQPLVTSGAAADLPLFSGQAGRLSTTAGSETPRNGPSPDGANGIAGPLTNSAQLALIFPVATPASETQIAAAPIAVAPTYRSVYSPRPPPARNAHLAEMLMIALALVGIVLAAILFKPVSLHALPSLARATIGHALAHVQSQAVTKSSPRAAATHATAIHSAALHPHVRPAPTMTAASAPAPVASLLPQAPPKQTSSQKVSTKTHRTAAVKSHAPTAAHPVPAKNLRAASSASAAPPPADPTALSAAQRQSIARAQLRATQRRSASPAAPIVSVEGLGARYSSLGRAVRINWSAGGQSSASVALIDSRGAVLSSLTVTGAQQSARLPLPLRYRSSVVVQLTSTGRLGERVVQTVSLAPYSP